MADIYDCVFLSPVTPPATPTGSESPNWTFVESDTPKLLVTIRDGNGEKIVAFQVDKEK
jgi:hypothetical protein